MKVLVLGATGFIGAAVVEALLRRGDEVVAGVRDYASGRRRWPAVARVEVDFRRDTTAAHWAPRLQGVDAVVNAVGVFRAPPAAMQAIHADTPIALFDACAAAGVRVLQVSALGAARDAPSAFLRSKNLADEHLLALGAGAVVRPSLVFGLGGRSTQTLLDLALAPLWPLPGGGRQRVQPIHLDDLVEGILALLDPARGTVAIDAVGARALRLRDYLHCLRSGLGRGRGRVVPVPLPMARTAARLLGWSSGLVDPAAIDMLEGSRPADPVPFRRVLGRRPRDCRRFLQPPLSQIVARHWPARADLVLLRLALAFVWLASGLVSLFVHPLDDSLRLLQQAGVPPSLAPAALVGAAGIDLVFGVLLLFAPRGRRAYLWQIALILGYSCVIALMLPEFLWHPYAPVLKNVPLLAALWLLHRDEQSRWTT
jgi:uncharacterized protein YbjT (DUF2867 family)